MSYFAGILLAVTAASPDAQEADRLALARAAYESRYVWFEDRRVQRRVVGAPREVTLVRVGKQGTVLVGEEAYLAIDRPDLAASYRTRKILKWSAFFGGLALSVGAYTYRTVGVRCLANDPTTGECLERDPVPLAIGTGVTVGGVAIAVFAAIFNPNPVVGEEFKKLGDEFNEKLKRELRLTDVSASIDPLRGTVGVAGRF